MIAAEQGCTPVLSTSTFTGISSAIRYSQGSLSLSDGEEQVGGLGVTHGESTLRHCRRHLTPGEKSRLMPTAFPQQQFNQIFDRQSAKSNDLREGLRKQVLACSAAVRLSHWKISFGAEEGTRTPTPLRVHGPEPCASANSATSALNEAPDKQPALATGNTHLF